MRIRLLLAALLCSCFTAFAGAEENVDNGKKKSALAYRGFIGGMMIHSGYVFSKNATFMMPQTGESHTVKASGAPAGIGGAIKLMFGKHLRVGGEGYVSSLTYGEYRSHASMGWGGVLAEAAWRAGKWNLFAGGLLGGGSVRNVTLLASAGNDFEADNVSYRKYGFLAVAPYIGTEYAVSRRINLVFKIDYVINVSNPQDDFITGPRVFLGFMFGHSH
ncbi:MAG: hypothetical protein NC115_10690 [Bacteroidales bacterium]|nr:hypothetical protein [Bacteroides sp.]MCM1198709.1 hypothetical protein [Clostridium sp.]MCM1503112.1 hypothetical protein [Bacteroidales bacterium]